MKENPYKAYTLHMIPKLLTNLDRDSTSPTYGCFDRNYWHYKMHDFPSIILQQSGLSLSLLYLHDFDGNIYYKKKIIKDYAIASVDFWINNQNFDGSFPEYWAFERSIPSTAFSLYAVCEICDKLNYFPKKLKKVLIKAVNFLRKNSEINALNQEMASCSAIAYAAKISKNCNINLIAKKKIDVILKKQKKEGWFEEYGGVDIGYLTVFLDFLVRYYELTNEKRCLDTANKIIDFIIYFVHPDGSIGGEYCMRNTEYFLPYGFEYMKKYNRNSASLLKKLMSYIYQNKFLNSCIDERYMLHYVNSSFVKSLISWKEDYSNLKLPYETNFIKFFDEANILISSTDKEYFICSVLKGGTFKIIDKNTLKVCTNCGYKLLKGKKIYVNEFPENNKYELNKDKLIINSKFKKIRYFEQTIFKLILIKIISIIFGRNVVNLAKNRLIFNNKKSLNIILKREIFFYDKIKIKDQFNNLNNSYKVIASKGLSVRHTASSKFFQINSI
jgi:hypothetical protein